MLEHDFTRMLRQIKIFFLSILTASIASFTIYSQTQWEKVNPLQSTAVFLSVVQVDSVTAIAVGANGLIRKTTDKGVQWSEKQSSTNERLNCVSFGDRQTGMAAGANGTIVLTTDGGETWIISRQSSSYQFTSIHMFDTASVICVGSNGICLRSTNKGGSWSQVSVPVQDTIALRSVAFSRIGAVGVIVGDGGAVFNTRDSGKSWSRATSPTTANLTSASFSNDSCVMVAGAVGTVLRSTNAGSSWKLQRQLTSTNLLAVAFADPQNGVLLGAKGYLMNSNDSGVHWREISIPTKNNLYSLSFAKNSTGIAVGEFGSTIISIDSGKTFAFVSGDATRSLLLGVHFSSSLHGTAVGKDGVVVRTTDGGKTWQSQASGCFYDLWSVRFINDSTGVAVGFGGVVISTCDYGKTWQTLNRSVSKSFTGIAFLSDSIAIAVGSQSIRRSSDRGNSWITVYEIPSGVVYDVKVVSGQTLVAVGDYGNIYRSVNGGLSWDVVQPRVTTDNLYGLAFYDAMNGYAVGGTGSKGTMIKTTDGGESWSTVILPNSTNLLRGVCFTGKKIGCAVGYTGTVISSSDSGENWFVDTTNTTSDLYNISFSSPTRAVIVGDRGTILRRTNIPIVDDVKIEEPRTGLLAAGLIRPNPANDHSVISCKVGDRIAIIDSFGRTVLHYTSESDNCSFNRGSFVPGWYCLRISRSNSIAVEMFIID
jgi:photosystem II stability/assembly factor-like uncharacterized protein